MASEVTFGELEGSCSGVKVNRLSDAASAPGRDAPGRGRAHDELEAGERQRPRRFPAPYPRYPSQATPKQIMSRARSPMQIRSLTAKATGSSIISPRVLTSQMRMMKRKMRGGNPHSQLVAP